MPTRSARTVWTGGLQDGSGQTALVSSGLGTYDVSFPRRSAEAAEGYTSPEELIAAAHASCYAMAFSNGLAKNGTPASKLSVKVAVTFDKTDAGWGIASSAITVRGEVPGLDQAKFAELAEAAKEGCPVSKALKGNVALSVDATLG